MDNVFRTCGRDDQQGAFAGNYVVDHHFGSKIAVLHDKTAYGKGLADETQEAAERARRQGNHVRGDHRGRQGLHRSDHQDEAAGIDVIYLGGYHTEAGLITRQAHEQGLKAQMISGDALVTDEYWEITGDTGQGTLMTFSPDPRKNAVAQPVVAEFQAAGLRSRGLHALHLRRSPGLGRGGREGRLDRP